ncbi:hypothetical protein [Streptomyces sp. NPDC086519]|uniref:hypothetical protein n=1 Tax=Streptomyces sp. NPDC086519 TaxID=3154863 RepID=UPI00343AFA4D
MVFPREIDLQPFRVLLLLAMDTCTPEELHDLGMEDVEFTDGGVRLRQTKHRAARTRHRRYADAPATVPEREAEYPGEGRWDVPGLLRRLVAVTEPVRCAYPDLVEWLWVAAEPAGTGCARLAGRRAGFVLAGRRFTDWITRDRGGAVGGVQITAPHNVRRLRKTAKITRAVVLGGAVADLAGDDHQVEVFRRHYAHGTTAHVLAGRALTGVQHKVFASLTRPVFADEETVADLAEPEVAAALGLEPAWQRRCGRNSWTWGWSTAVIPSALRTAPQGRSAMWRRRCACCAATRWSSPPTCPAWSCWRSTSR